MERCRDVHTPLLVNGFINICRRAPVQKVAKSSRLQPEAVGCVPSTRLQPSKGRSQLPKEKVFLRHMFVLKVLSA